MKRNQNRRERRRHTVGKFLRKWPTLFVGVIATLTHFQCIIKLVNVLFSDFEQPSKTYLFNSTVLETVNHKTVSQLINDCIREISNDRSNFLLLLSDAASYMIKAGILLKTLFLNLVHVTCFSHLLHNCALRVKSYCSNVDNLISTIKAATVNNETRRSLSTEIGYPPEPVVTRWGS